MYKLGTTNAINFLVFSIWYLLTGYKTTNDSNVTYSEHHKCSETPTRANQTSIKVCDDVIDNEEVIESSIVACYICPECGRKTNSKKQLYRHAAQVGPVKYVV